MADEIDRQAVREVAEKLQALNRAIAGAGHLGIKVELQPITNFGDASPTYIISRSVREEHILPS